MKQATAKKTSFGRPRLLTEEGILNAAIELGLENVTMKKLSTHLNVGTATLYQYFDSRKTLMRAAAVHALVDLSLPEDTGQSWEELARGYCLELMQILADNPTYINTMSPTDYGFEVHFKLIEPFLQSMKKRGIPPKHAMQLFNQIGLIAYGGAVETIRQREFEFQDETMDIVARRQFNRMPADKFPLMASVLNDFTQTPEAKTEKLLASLFRAFAEGINIETSKRGEI